MTGLPCITRRSWPPGPTSGRTVRPERTASGESSLPSRRDPTRPTAEDHVLGSLGAPLQVVLYGDLTCSDSASLIDAIHHVVLRYPCVSAAFRHLFPIGDPLARRAAMAAEAAEDSGEFWPFISRVYAYGADPSALRAHFTHLGLDERSLVDHGRHARGAVRLNDDRLLAAQCAATPPAVFINGIRWHAHRSSLLGDDLLLLVERTRSLWATTSPAP